MRGKCRKIESKIMVKNQYKYDKVKCGTVIVVGNKAANLCSDFFDDLPYCFFQHLTPLDFCVTQDARICQYNERFNRFMKRKENFEVAEFFCPMIYLLDEKDVLHFLDAKTNFPIYLAVGRARNIMHIICLQGAASKILEIPNIVGNCDLLIIDKGLQVKSQIFPQIPVIEI